MCYVARVWPNDQACYVVMMFNETISLDAIIHCIPIK